MLKSGVIENWIIFCTYIQTEILEASSAYTNCQSSKDIFTLRPTVHMQKESQVD